MVGHKKKIICICKASLTLRNKINLTGVLKWKCLSLIAYLKWKVSNLRLPIMIGWDLAKLNCLTSMIVSV